MVGLQHMTYLFYDHIQSTVDNKPNSDVWCSHLIKGETDEIAPGGFLLSKGWGIFHAHTRDRIKGLNQRTAAGFTAWSMHFEQLRWGELQLHIEHCGYEVFWTYAVVYSLLTFLHSTDGEPNMPPAAATNLAHKPPDGGWGWAVVVAAFISIGFSYAFPKSLTIYFKEIQEYFSVSYSEIAWLSSVMLASMYAGGEWQPKSQNFQWNEIVKNQLNHWLPSHFQVLSAAYL